LNKVHKSCPIFVVVSHDFYARPHIEESLFVFNKTSASLLAIKQLCPYLNIPKE
jgi:hypothetical protein